MVSLSDDDVKSRAFDYNIIKRFLPYVLIYKKDVFLGFMFIILLTISSLLLPLVIKNIIDQSGCLIGSNCDSIEDAKSSILVGLFQYLGLSILVVISIFMSDSIIEKVGENILLDSNQEQVMMAWEKPYMQSCIDMLEPTGDVLEIGFGMGYSATHIQTYKPKSYTIIECDPVVIKQCKEWAKDYNNVTIIEARWQEVLGTDKLKKYDQVFFDDFPNNIKIKTKFLTILV